MSVEIEHKTDETQYWKKIAIYMQSGREITVVTDTLEYRFNDREKYLKIGRQTVDNAPILCVETLDLHRIEAIALINHQWKEMK